MAKFELPELQFELDALEPHMLREIASRLAKHKETSCQANGTVS